MASMKVAKIYASNVFGIDLKDAIQEANKGVLESIEKYNLDYRTEQGNRVRFLTYAYKNAIKKVKEFIMNQSRLVRLPRTKLERIFLIIEASNKTHHSDNISQITKKANQILSKRRNRKLFDYEIISEEDVSNAIILLSGNSISLDHVNSYTLEESSRPKTIGDLIPSGEPSSEDILSEKEYKQEFINTLKINLTDIEYNVIYYKFLHFGYEKSLEEMQDILESLINKKLSRERINQIKTAAFKKLKNLETVRGLCFS